MVDESEDQLGVSQPVLPQGVVVAGKYQIGSVIARGQLAVVYQATQLPIGRQVVLKVLVPGTAVLEVDPHFAERFRREAATYARLTHPNTVTMYEFGEYEHQGRVLYFMALEFVQGRTLRQLLKDAGGRLPPDRVIDFACQILRSLKEAHGLGIVHRDLKPRNIMVANTEDGERVRVLDFGVAKVAFEGGDASEDALTRTGTVLGSPHYMAPEQIRLGVVDGRTDIYALGCVMFEMLAGAPPFRGNGMLETCAAHLTSEVPAMPGVPAELEAVVRRCLAKSSEERFRDADELMIALRRLREGTEELGSLRSVSLAAAAPSPRQTPSRGVMVGLAAVLLAISVATLLVAVLLTLVLLGGTGAGTAAPPEPAAPAPVTAAPEEPAAEPAPEVVAEAVHDIRSTPSGAEVLLRGRVLGTTPLLLGADEVPAGESLVLRKAGYVERTVRVEELRAPVALKAIPTPRPQGFRPDVRTER